MHLEWQDYYSTAKEVLDAESTARANAIPCDLYTRASSSLSAEGDGKSLPHSELRQGLN